MAILFTLPGISTAAGSATVPATFSSTSSCSITSIGAINSSRPGAAVKVNWTGCNVRRGISLIAALGGGYDSAACGTQAPTFEVIDRGGGSHNWSAGRETCVYKDPIGLALERTGRLHGIGSNGMVFFGFGQKFLGRPGVPKYYNIGSGDPIEFIVYPRLGSPASINVTAT